MTQFDIDYKRGKESEIESLPDLKQIFENDLNYDPYEYAHFDYHSNLFMVELKTRDRVVYKDGQFNYTTRDGRDMILDSLYFDNPKRLYRMKQKNKGCKKTYWIIWKCNGEYFGWLMNDNDTNNKLKQDEYYIETQNRDVGFGHKQNRDVVHVKAEYIIKLS